MPFNILCVGSLIPRKGLDLLLNALAIIKDSPWTLTIAGDGPIKALINDPQKAETMGRAGKERTERFTFENVSKGFISAIEAK